MFVTIIYLNNLSEQNFFVDSLIWSDSYGKMSFNIDVAEREECIERLYSGQEYILSEDDDESVKNIFERFSDIEELFPEDLKGDVLPYFIDWLKDNVIFVEITTYSEENAYTIFETMNDRGLNLTPTEMLKGYLLSKIKIPDRRNQINELWKKRINELHESDKDEDLEFFKAWLRAKYAKTIRPGKKGAANEDFEKIGTRFHTWVIENLKKLNLNTQDDYYNFIKENFDFYSKLYMKINDAQSNIEKGLEHLYYMDCRPIAYSLSFPLLISPIKITDDEKIIDKKLSLVGRFIETYIVYRSVNKRTLGQSSIRYTVYSLVKEIRDKNIDELAKILKDKLNSLDESIDGIQWFGLHHQNRNFVHFLLARITHHIEKNSGIPSNFEDYMNNGEGKQFEIEHIWPDKFENHLDEFKQRDEFEGYRNLIGGLILLPHGTNQSFNDDSYNEKLRHYLRENLLAQTLHPQCYEKNPNFLKYAKESVLSFEPHEQFKNNDLIQRQNLYKEICEEIWNLNGFDQIVNS